jgi:polysaccharide biosynthesis protein PslH
VRAALFTEILCRTPAPEIADHAGGGVRLKIYEAMAMAKPIVSTRVGAEGLPVREGADLMLADSAEDFAAATIRVLTDEPFARELGRRARAAARAAHSWASVAARFADICRRVAHRRLEGESAAGEEPITVEA